jgi:hypothetical protein
MAASGVRGIDLFKIAGRSISGWIPNLKTGSPGHVRQPFCSHLEYHPQVICYTRGDIDAQFAAHACSVRCVNYRSVHAESSVNLYHLC